MTIEEFACPSCQKKHENVEPICAYCGQDLKEAIVAYNKRVEPLLFYQKIKAGEKRRRKYGDRMMKEEFEKYIPITLPGHMSRRERMFWRRIGEKIPNYIKVILLILFLGVIGVGIWAVYYFISQLNT
ncbi:MAG: hypothetical protein ACTSQF_14590 [Candidatus Heimdallarchaeaceae archaeon]